MCEQGGGEVAREPVTLRPTNPDASRREGLEFRERRPDGSRMGYKNPIVLAQESRDGNRLWRREREVEEYPPIGRVLAALRPRRVQPLRQRLTGRWMLILAQPQKVVGADFTGQSKSFRARAEPFAGYALAFIVVIADAEVFLEVFPCVLEVVLRLCRDHASDTTRTVRACCVSHTSSQTRLVVNCQA